jgi:hypothetical protein
MVLRRLDGSRNLRAISAAPSQPIHIRARGFEASNQSSTKEIHLMTGRTIARILLVVVLVGAAIGIGVTAYDAGVTSGLAQTGQVVVRPDGYAVAPYVGYGWGFGHGFGFFGFLGMLLFLFLLLGLIRAAFGGRRGWGPGGHHGEGRDWRGGDWRGSPWESRAREIHDEWHRGQTDGGDKPAAG